MSMTIDDAISVTTQRATAEALAGLRLCGFLDTVVTPLTSALCAMCRLGGSAFDTTFMVTRPSAIETHRTDLARAVKARMLRMGHYLEVAPVVVPAIFVTMVDNLIRVKVSTKALLGNQTVFGNVSVGIGGGVIGPLQVDVAATDGTVGRIFLHRTFDELSVALAGTDSRRGALRFVGDSADLACVHDRGNQATPGKRFVLALARTVSSRLRLRWADGESRPTDLAGLYKAIRLAWHFVDLHTGRLKCRGAGLFQQSRPYSVGGIIP